MKSLCFILESIPFDINTPHKEPIGGTESAVSYLLPELAKVGFNITLLSKNNNPSTIRNVKCRDISISLNTEFFERNNFDAVVLLSNSYSIIPLRQDILPTDIPLYFWAHHDSNQPASAPLSNRFIANEIHRFIFISQYQKNQYIQQLGLKHSGISILPNGISPYFENLFPSLEDFKKHKQRHIATYTSTPFRGLDLLANIARDPIDNLYYEIYSSMRVYKSTDEPFRALYDFLKNCPQTKLHGSISQKELAVALKEFSFLTYPNTFPETFCISAIEAVAAGLEIISSHIGALPEICLPYGTFVPVSPGNPAPYLMEFKKILIEKLNFKTQFFDLWCERAYENSLDVQRKYTWKNIAEKWKVVFDETLK